MLNDEVRSASGIRAVAYEPAVDPNAPRYGEQANVENHPQITDFVPRRKLAVLTTLLAGVGAAAVAATLIRYAEPIAAALPGVAPGDLSAGLAGGVVAWTSAIAWLLIAALAKLIFSLRRHRVDDYRGRYRVWKWFGRAALLGSVAAVTPALGLLGKSALHATGWSFSPSGVEWGLIPLTIVGGWLLAKLLLEIGESRSATALMLAAAACYGLAAAGTLGWSPAPQDAWKVALTSVWPLVGTTIALASMMVFARYVVLDVQGLIDHAPRQADASAADQTVQTPPTHASSWSNAAPVAAHGDHRNDDRHDYEWSDDDQADDDAADRKLSKAERKRLRRQQRAA